jgi:lipopolysaccharide/colanic/teichoic acid biosynthesis glycosyltransferase
VLVDSGWPPLYSQMRVGLMGQQFRLWKFRTMVRDAEEMQPTLSAVNEAPFPTFKMRDDPRVTRTGRFLRRSSLDELPQLWNVLLGQMSLVGPRPPLASEVAHYDQRALGRLCVRPGLTCVWQVDGRDGSATSFEKWLAMDLQYIEHWSIGSDFVIIAKTFAAIGKMTGQ